MNTPDPRKAAPAAPVVPADSYGAYDLAERASLPANDEQTPATGEGLHIPLITSADEAGFQDVMSTSQAVPVILALWSSRSLESKPTLPTILLV